MKYLKSAFYLLSIILYFAIVPVCIFAQDKTLPPSITIINLIRGNELGHEHDDLVESLKVQWQITKESDVYATWLLQYGALDNPLMMEFIKKEMIGQEFGLLLEIDRTWAEKSHVLYRGQGSWYFSDGLFLNSYDTNDRRKLIDTAFYQFKRVFGYYPKTVGAWWIGGDSLTYMQKRYGITGALRASDQFNLDFYSLWGTPWSIPYLASKVNQAIPAKSFDESSKVVILQWAARDPLKGYENPLYSIQDYTMKEYSHLYVNYMASVYLARPFNNIIIGLENGGTFEDFNRNYKTMLMKAKEIALDNKVQISLAKDYTNVFLDQKKVFPNQRYFLSKGFDSDNQSFWYTSERYRVFIQKIGTNIYLTDLRDYSKKTEEDFYTLPNTEKRLRINTTEKIESARFPEGKVLLTASNDPLMIKEESEDLVTLLSGKQIVGQFFPDTMHLGYGEKERKTFNFEDKIVKLELRTTLSILFALYFVICLLVKKNGKKTVCIYSPLLVPFIFALFFMESESTYLFDRKELPLFALAFLFRSLSIYDFLFWIKIIPFIVLFILHFFNYFGHSNQKGTRLVYGIYLILISFMYMHLPYFPIDKTTLPFILASYIFIFVVLIIGMFMLIQHYQTMKTRVCIVISMFVILCMVVCVTFISRTKLALPQFEIAALQRVSENKKGVVYVEQFDDNVKPIYKAIKPLLYDSFGLRSFITGSTWTIAERPKNHILQLGEYKGEYIYVPKYLGSDLSEYETHQLKIKKIFDNAQIQIFEKI